MSMSRKMALSASAAAAALACAGSALAQVPSNWSGPYLGATLGYGASHFNNVYHVYELTTGTTGADNVSLSGLVGGLQAGYRAEMGSNVVLGARVGALWTGVRGSGTAISCPAAACFLNNSTTQNDQVTSAQTLQLDVGYAMGEWLPYVTAGGALGQFKGYGSVSNVFGSTKFSYTKSVGGWLVGGGVERRIDPHWSVKAEYEYLNFPAFTEIAPAGAIGQTGVKIDENLFQVGLNFQF